MFKLWCERCIGLEIKLHWKKKKISRFINIAKLEFFASWTVDSLFIPEIYDIIFHTSITIFSIFSPNKMASETVKWFPNFLLSTSIIRTETRGMETVSKNNFPLERAWSTPPSSCFKDVRFQKFPRKDFFKTLTAGRK